MIGFCMGWCVVGWCGGCFLMFWFWFFWKVGLDVVLRVLVGWLLECGGGGNCGMW